MQGGSRREWQVGNLGESGESLKDYEETGGVGEWSERRQGPGESSTGLEKIR